jgi:hypothetical protein
VAISEMNSEELKKKKKERKKEKKRRRELEKVEDTQPGKRKLQVYFILLLSSGKRSMTRLHIVPMLDLYPLLISVPLGLFTLCVFSG